MKLNLIIMLIVSPLIGYSTDYDVGPGEAYANISDVPWEAMLPGDNVFIHYRLTPYAEKWNINVPGTSSQPFSVIGVLGPNGERPIITGENAITRTELNYWSDERGVIKIGGSSIPNNATPSHIIVENLEIKSGHINYTYTDDAGNLKNYLHNTASIYIESGENITIRNCVLHDSGNGIFSAYQTTNLLLEKNHIYGNGNVGRFLEHNAYTESNGITYQYNRFGPLRSGADGNNLKDRSAGLVVRYNWIEGGNRLLDLVESSHNTINTDPTYSQTFVYGNILIEEDGGNNQVAHYGGDNGTTSVYRKGKLYFYNNTLYSIRAGNTTLLRLSTDDETADIRNNILFVTASGNRLALLNVDGVADISHNIMKSGWVNSHSSSFSGVINDDGSSIETEDPGFNDAASYDFSLRASSIAIDNSTDLHSDVIGNHEVDMIYLEHLDGLLRINNGPLDVGGFEAEGSLAAILNTPFKAFNEENSVLLNWTTNLEIEVDHYEIKRRDAFGESSVIVHPHGPGKEYNISDFNLPPGEVEYQLWEVNAHGDEIFLGNDVVTIEDQKTRLINNVVRHQLKLFISEAEAGRKWRVIDMEGKTLLQGKLNDANIDVTFLPYGKYLFHIDQYSPTFFIKL